MSLHGQKVTLTPLKSKEKYVFFEMATRSYGSEFWYDHELKKKRSKEKFFQDWHEGYFDTSQPEAGQCYWIQVNGKNIGMVNYNKIDLTKKEVELDIIIGDKENIGKGYGSDALKTLITYLFENLHLHKIWLEARGNNPRAIRAYQKAGFKQDKVFPKKDYFNGEYVDCIRFSIVNPAGFM